MRAARPEIGGKHAAEHLRFNIHMNGPMLAGTFRLWG
jgi:hypothetical protein